MRILETFPTALYLLLGCLLATPLAAQAPEPSPEAAAVLKAMTPGSQHTYLASFEGTWKATLLVWPDPDAEPIRGTGILKRKMVLGGRVLEEHLQGEIMGMPFNGIGHVGYDNVTSKYWGTWCDSFSTGVITVGGDIDESNGSATLIGEASEPIAGKRVPLRLVFYEEDGMQISEAYSPVPGKGTFLTMKTIYERQ